MKESESNRSPETAAPTLSRRAALRLMQRACVLAGRDRRVRRHIREARLATRWALRDWGLEWTVMMDRGALRFERRPARRSDVRFTWPSAEDFFRNVAAGSDAPGLETEGEPAARGVADQVRRVFLETLGKVLEYPYDEDGRRLA